MNENIQRQNAKLSLIIRAQEEKLMETYSDIKPYLVRLFTHALLLFISLRAFNNFQNSKSNYEEFLLLLNETLVDDAIITTDSCDTLGKDWRTVDNVTFPNILKGCRCDANLYIGQSCDYISAVNPINSNNFERNCLIYDELLNNNIDPTDDIYFKNMILPDEFYQQLESKEFDFVKYNEKYGDVYYSNNSFKNNTNGYRRRLDMLKTTFKFNNMHSNSYKENYFNNSYSKKESYYNKYNSSRFLQRANSRNLTLESKKIISTHIYILLTIKFPKLKDTINLPKNCKCFKSINEQPEKNISFIYGKRDYDYINNKDISYRKNICYKKSNFTTLSYLASSFVNCTVENQCQKYFCRRSNQKCPIVDIYERNLEQVQSIIGFNYTKSSNVS
jgi:hypothetical protein